MKRRGWWVVGSVAATREDLSPVMRDTRSGEFLCTAPAEVELSADEGRPVEGYDALRARLIGCGASPHGASAIAKSLTR